MDAIAGGCVSSVVKECMPCLGFYIEADRAQFICHPGNLLLHSTWWIDTRRRKFCSLTRIETKHADDMWGVGPFVSDNNVIFSL
jgi:hypothetical protein